MARMNAPTSIKGSGLVQALRAVSAGAIWSKMYRAGRKMADMRMGTSSRAMTIIMNRVTTKNRRMGAVNTSPIGIRNSNAGTTMATSHFNKTTGERLVVSMCLSPFC